MIQPLTLEKLQISSSIAVLRGGRLFVVGILCLSITVTEGRGADFEVAGVSVATPHNQVVAADEAVNITGSIRVTGIVPENPPTVSGAVDVGYWIRVAVYNPFTEQSEFQDRFVIVRHLTVTAVPTEGVHSGRGESLPFDIWCNSPPPWRDDVIYWCIGDPRDDGDTVGTFAVGLSPSEQLPWWLAWLFY